MGDNNKRDTDDVKVTQKELDDIFLILRNVQNQMQTYEEYQVQSYKWNMQHHSNIKKIMDSLNRISSVLQIKTGADQVIQIQPTEDESLITFPKRVYANKSKEGNKYENKEKGILEKRRKVESFHDAIMSASYRHDYCILPTLLLDISTQKFSELQESSAEMLLPIAASWLSGISPDKISIALAYLYEAYQRFPIIFTKSENMATVKRAAKVISDMDKKGVVGLPLSKEELDELETILLQSIAPSSKIQ